MKASREYGRGATAVGHSSHRFLLTKRTQGARTATRFAVGRAATAWKRALVVAGAFALAIAASGGASAAAAAAPLSANVTVFASGLNNPRGLAFGPGGDLFVAEGGLGGGLMTTPAECTQVPSPVGPYSGGFTSRISKIDPHGVRTTVAGGLPSSQTSPALGSLVSGVADVAFVGDRLYALEAGAGCSHGLLGTDNSILRVNPDGTTTPVADLSQFLKSHPVAQPNADDFEPDGTWYSMAAVRGDLYAVEPNHGEIDRINPSTGAISRVIDVSASQGHIVPTALAYKGNFFFGNLGTFPVTPGSESLFKVTPSGQIKTWATGLTTVLGLVAGSRDRLYALESMTAPGFPGPGELGTGQVVRIDPSGAQTVIATGLSFPTAMTLGPDGALYVSNLGFGGPVPGLGQILKITVPG
jgi:sugar lactone lactonase YvrE